MRCLASSTLTAPGSTGGVRSTGRVVSRSTRSVVDPKNNLRIPVRPCVLMTIRSQERSRATRRISTEGLPTATSYSSVASIAARVPNVLPANRSTSRLLSSGFQTTPVPRSAASVSSGSATVSTISRAAKCAAIAAAYRNAPTLAAEKSTGQRIDGLTFMAASMSCSLARTATLVPRRAGRREPVTQRKGAWRRLSILSTRRGR